EVDSLSPAAQSKMLRFLEGRSFKPLGAQRFVEADVNVLSATNADLGALVRRKQFLPDLYFRSNILQVRLPPLRERPGDIDLLACHFLDSLVVRPGAGRKSFSPSALRKLVLHE